ncbi:oxygen-independent coproporphyrinogen III oxidase [Terrimonas alba]|uniref:oxygen-independent coproporphyrinogen III oxidase n=1 Tax=Terrimonas alba TaxID=3349636 RepID=UPI0035F4B4E8
MNTTSISPLLVRKYNQPVPRYTSYPTVPFWYDNIDKEKWKGQFARQFDKQNAANGISIYIHLPFCESLCTYCGCNKKITQNHSVEEEYLAAIEKEWKLYRRLMSQTPVIREIHLGGGTPTFFSPQNLKRLLDAILKYSIVHPQHEFSIEGHPNNTTKQHLKLLYSLGFRRISYGVQDLDPEVQRVINRIQPFENVKQATENARAAGFRSVNFDLIYGLPLQNIQSIENTINQVITLKPDRIAFYSYAHVPWTSRGQRLFNETDLPGAEEKILLYLRGKELLTAHGYTDIGMDHFALPHDELFVAKQNGKLHRNFMGYTTQNSGLLLGLGVSSISDLGNAFAQNDKTLHNYYALINKGELAVTRGYFLNEEDLAFRQYIKDISCKGATVFQPEHLPVLQEFCFPQLEQLAADGLVEFDLHQLKITEEGHYFIRNICAAFDLYLQRGSSLTNKETFSKAI